MTATAPLRLVLASASPRRRELLERLGLPLLVAPAHIDESPGEGESGPAHVARIAAAKAALVAARHPDLPVLAADTAVLRGGRILGKPGDRSEAAEMLAALAGTTHVVATAVTVRWREATASHLELARVTFVPFDAELYAWYVGTGEGDDKAGAYAVQGKGAVLVERVEGNVQAVVGLPLAAVPSLLRSVGLRLAPAGNRLALAPAGGTEGKPLARG